MSACWQLISYAQSKFFIIWNIQNFWDFSTNKWWQQFKIYWRYVWEWICFGLYFLLEKIGWIVSKWRVLSITNFHFEVPLYLHTNAKLPTLIHYKVNCCVLVSSLFWINFKQTYVWPKRLYRVSRKSVQKLRKWVKIKLRVKCYQKTLHLPNIYHFIFIQKLFLSLKIFNWSL